MSNSLWGIDRNLAHCSGSTSCVRRFLSAALNYRIEFARGSGKEKGGGEGRESWRTAAREERRREGRQSWREGRREGGRKEGEARERAREGEEEMYGKSIGEREGVSE